MGHSNLTAIYLLPERRSESEIIPGTPEAEFQAWLAANPVELPDTRKHQLRAPARPLSPQGTRWRLLAVAIALVVTVIAMTWLLTLLGRARLIP